MSDLDRIMREFDALPDARERSDAMSSIMAEFDALPDVERPGTISNIVRGAGERVLDLGGGFLRGVGGAAEAAGDALERAIPLGGFEWDERGIRYKRFSDEDIEAEGVKGVTDRAAGALEDTSLGYRPGTTWEDVKASPLRKFIPFAIEQGLVSTPDMVAALTALPAYVAARTGEVGQARSEADLRENATVGDLLVALPPAIAMSMLERIGAKGMFGLDEAAIQSLKQVPQAALGAGVKEAATEAAQEGIEYGTTTIGTATGFDPAQAIDQMAAGAVAGGTFGAGVRAGTGAIEARLGGRSRPTADAQPANPAEALFSDLPDVEQQSLVEQGGPAPDADLLETLTPSEQPDMQGSPFRTDAPRVPAQAPAQAPGSPRRTDAPLVPASPATDPDPDRISSPRLTPQDRNSPLPNAAIDDGKKIMEDALAGNPVAPSGGGQNAIGQSPFRIDAAPQGGRPGATAVRLDGNAGTGDGLGAISGQSPEGEPAAGVEPRGETSPAIDDMRRNPGSWVIRNRQTGEVVMETFDRRAVDALNTEKYEAIPAIDYLAGLNSQIRAAGGTQPAQVTQEAAPAIAQPETASSPVTATPEVAAPRIETPAQPVAPAPRTLPTAAQTEIKGRKGRHKLVVKKTGEEVFPGQTFKTPLDARKALKQARAEQRVMRPAAPKTRAQKVRILKRPAAAAIMARGGIDPDSPIARELASRDITPRTFPGLFRRGGLRALDNIPRSEESLFRGGQGDFATDVGNERTYIQPDEWVAALEAEYAGNPLRTADEMAQEASRAEPRGNETDMAAEYAAAMPLVEREFLENGFDAMPDEMSGLLSAQIAAGYRGQEAVDRAIEEHFRAEPFMDEAIDRLSDEELDELAGIPYTGGPSSQAADDIPFFGAADEQLQSEGARDTGKPAARGADREAGTGDADREDGARVPQQAREERGADGRPQLTLGDDFAPDQAGLARLRADAPLRGKANQRPMDEGLFGDGAAQTDLVDMARRPEFAVSPDADAASALVEMTEGDDAFAFPRSEKTGRDAVITDVARGIAPMGRVDLTEEDISNGAARKFLYRTAQDKDFYVYENDDGEVWIDVSRMEEGQGGNAIYAAVANYAHNAGKKFIGDPAGLSDAALRRRNEAMLSSALKFRTTRHLEPHPRQLQGAPEQGVPPLEWTPGDDLANLAAMAKVSADSTLSAVPELADARYDFDTRTFRTAEGTPLTDEDIREISRVASSDGAASIGSRTLKRGILFRSLARASSSERPRILGQIFRLGRQFLDGSGLEGIFYDVGQRTRTDVQRFRVGDGELRVETVRRLDQSADSVRDRFRADLDRIGLGDVAIDIVESIRMVLNGEASNADGQFWRGTITLALDGRSPDATFWHEIIHAAKAKGLFTEQEWAALERRSRAVWMKKYNIAEVYSFASETTQVEEGVAHAMAAWYEGRTKEAGVFRTIFEKMRNFFEAVGNALRGAGFQSAEDVLGRLYAGGLKGRLPRSESQGGAPEFQFAGPQSQTADIHALARARDMIEGGTSAEQVRQETGWFRGADGKWRYEITDEDARLRSDVVTPDQIREELDGQVTIEPDEKATRRYQAAWAGSQKSTWTVFNVSWNNGENRQALTGPDEQSALENLFSMLAMRRTRGRGATVFNPNDIRSGTEFALADILDHDRLFAAYPDLKMIPVAFDNTISALGQVNGYGSEMTLNPERFKGPDEMLSTILHEVQHLIQRREGFARGGSTEIAGSVREALRRLADAKDREVIRFKDDNISLFRDADEARRMVGFAQMYQDFNRLIAYSGMERPSGVFRHIRNATGWFYSEIIQRDDALRRRADDLNRSLYALPRRGVRRNRFLQQYAFDLAQLLRDAVPADRWTMLRADPRKTTSMIKALEREASKASARLKPHYDLTKEARLARSQFEANQYRSPFEVYQLLAGEVEARNTQARARMTDAERRETPPAQTMTRDVSGGGDIGSDWVIRTEDTKAPVSPEDVIVVLQTGEIASPMIANIGPSDATAQDRDQSTPQFSVAPPTSSEAFKRWFKDSKVVDADGKPLVVYHGTASDFEAFQAGRGNAGIWMSPDPASASRFAGGDLARQGNAGPNVIPAYASLQNPFDTASAPDNLLEPIIEMLTPAWANKAQARKIQAGHRRDWNAGDYNFIFGIGNGLISKRVRDFMLSRGVDGLIRRDKDGSIQSIAAFSPSQIKSVNNRGTFDPSDDRIMFELRRDAGQMPSSPSASFGQRFTQALAAATKRRLGQPDRQNADDGESLSDLSHRKLIDYLQPVATMQRELRDGNAQLADAMDVYLNARLAEDRALTDIQQMHDRHVTPIFEKLVASGVELEIVHDYMRALHAEERNRVVGLRNPEDSDFYRAVTDPTVRGASGISTNEAKDIINKLRADPKKFAAIKAASNRIRAMLDESLDRQYEAGLIDKDTYDLLRAQWRNYVPLKGNDGQDVDGHWTPVSAGGFDVRGDEFKAAMGRYSEAENVLAHAVAQVENAILRKHKNDVGKAALRLINQFDPEGKTLAEVYWTEEPGFASILKAKQLYKRVLKNGKVTVEKKPNNFSRLDDVLATKVGGKTFYIRFKDPKVGMALRKIGMIELDVITRTVRHVSVWQSIINTRYNPAFAPINLMRDAATGLIHLMDEGFTAKEIGTVFKSMPDAARAMWRRERGAENRTGEWDKYADEYAAAGGKITFDTYSDFETALKKMQKQMNATARGRASPMRAWSDFIQLIDDINDAGENMIRLSAYVQARKKGMSEKRAAFLARDLTVDFKKRGEYGPALNSWFVFFNAAIQGNYNIARRLAKSRKVQAATGAIIFGGMMQHVLNSLLAGDDDDGENAYHKMLKNEPWKVERQMVFFIPGTTRYVSMPMPYGYNAFWHLGVQGGAMASGVKGPMEGLADSFRVAFDAFNPIGSGSLLTMISPTVADPVIELATNQNFANAPIYPEGNPFDASPPPDSTQAFRSTGSVWKWMAEELNEITGGNKVEPGAIDIYPDTLEHLWGFFTGGVGRFIAQSGETTGRALDGEFEPQKTPWVRSFYGRLDEQSQRTEYFRLRESIMEVDGWMRDYDREERADLESRKPVEVRAIGAFKAAEKQRRAINKMRRAIEADERLSAAERKERLDALEKDELKVMLGARKAYREIWTQVNGD